MSFDQLPVPATHVIHQSVSEGAVLFSPVDEVYFGLNEVGSKIWELLPPAMATFAELCDALSVAYPMVDRGVIEQDAEELLTELMDHGLVAVQPGAEGAASARTASGT